jgi:multidrug transporter EmrE-like cation transporter
MSISNLLLILFSISLNAFAQIALKIGSGKIGSPNISLSFFLKLLNIPIFSGLFLYAISILSWIIALSKVDVSTAYPMLSIGYIIVALIAYFFLGENISLFKSIAIIIIIIGVIMISKS